MPPDSAPSEAPTAAPPAQAYLVLARKYRPQRFADLTGQEHVVRTLTNALKGGRVAHAFLFCGPRGCGKTTSARILARALNCQGADGQRQGPADEPCGKCAPCVEIASGIDVDVQEIDAASNNGVDDVRQLREAARYLPARDRYKIYIVDEVHMLSSAAFNALLKTLEEPPGHIKFLLATTDPQKLPATILSRVQRHNFQLVPLGKIVARLREIALAERVQASDGALSLVARQAQGSMRDALSLFDQLLSAHDPALGEIGDEEAAQTLGALDRRVAAEAVSGVLRRDPSAALAAIVRAYEAGAEMKRFAEEVASHARNLVMVQLPGVKLDLPEHELRELQAQAAQSDPAQLARVFELLQAAQDEVAKAATPRFALEVALLRAVHLAPAGGLPELLTRVEQLAGKLGGVAPAAPAGDKSRTAPPWVSRGLPGSGASLVRAESTPAELAQPAAPQEPPRPLAPALPSVPTAALAPPALAPAPAPAQAPAPAPAQAPAPAPAPAQARAPAPAPAPALAPALAPARAPAPAPATSPAPASTGSREELWRLLVETVRASRRSLAAVLEHAVPLELTPARVVIALPRAQLRLGILDDRDSRAFLEGAFERTLGQRPQLETRELTDAAAASGSGSLGAAQQMRQSLAEQQRDARSRASSARLALGREHPSVHAALELLGAEIEDVRDLGEEG